MIGFWEKFVNVPYLQKKSYKIGLHSKNVLVIIGKISGVSNSNHLTDRIGNQRYSASRTLKEKWLCGPQFLEESCTGPNMTLFLIFIA